MTQIIFLLVILVIFWLASNADSCLSGFWEASPEFCEEANLDNLILFLKDDQLFGKRSAYVLIESGGIPIINEPTTVTISMKADPRNLGKVKYFTINFENLYSNVEPDVLQDLIKEFPKKQNLTYYPCGKIVLWVSKKSEHKITAVLYKNSQASEK